MLLESIMPFIQSVYEFTINYNDAVFMILLYFLTCFGLAIKRIENAEQKRWLGSCMGLSTVFLIMGLKDSWHFISSVIVCAMIIIKVGKRRCHLAALIFMFFYLTVYRILIRSTMDNTTNYRYINSVHMLMFMKVVGVAFEIHYSDKNKKCYEERKIIKDNEDVSDVDPTFTEIVHYAFSFTGMHLGPYIRYRSYDDYLHLPFARAVGSSFTYKQMVLSLVYGAIHIAIESTWPIQYTITQAFSSSTMLYKTIYIFITFENVHFWMYSVGSISEAIASSVGLGAYPEEGLNKSGHGPTNNYAKLRKMDSNKAAIARYDFKTLRSVDIMAVQFSPWIPETIKAWNKTGQYFMGMYVFKVLPNSWNKSLRTFITLMLSALWHGIDSGYFIGLGLMPLYMPAETVFRKQCEKMTKWKAGMVEFFNWAVWKYLGGLLGLFVLLAQNHKVWTCLAALRYSPFILLICLNILAWAVKNAKKIQNKA